jgi:tartrate/fumarate subfamily iron-sulfur-dependent hydro-lyase beta chain
MDKVLKTPLTVEDIKTLRIGDVVYLEGVIYTSRDMAHMTIRDRLEKGRDLPVDFQGAAVFHAGPVVRKTHTGWELGVIGPTSSIRMEPYAEIVGKLGVRVIIGKGGMRDFSRDAFQKYGQVYLQAAPGCAALLADGIEKIEEVHWFDLGMPEALWVLKAKKFGPLVVAMDSRGNSIYQDIRDKATEMIDVLYRPA